MSSESCKTSLALPNIINSVTEGTCKEEHGTDLPFECTDCGKCFRYEKILSIHQRVHTYNFKKPYKCNHCGKAYASSGCLLLHLRREHTGERPYECDICKKTFIDHYSCRRHTLIHSKDDNLIQKTSPTKFNTTTAKNPPINTKFKTMTSKNPPINTKFGNITQKAPPPIVLEKFESKQTLKKEAPVILVIKKPSFLVAVVNYPTQKFPPTEVEKEVELEETRQEETSVTVNGEASSLVDTLIDSQTVESPSQFPSTVSEKNEPLEIPVTSGIGTPSHFMAVADGHVDTTLDTPSAVVKKEFDSQQTCKEIPVTLGIEGPSIFVGDTQFDNYSTQEFPPTGVKKDFELQQTHEEEILITVNGESSSLVNTLIDSQTVESPFQFPYPVIKKEEPQQTCSKEILVASNIGTPSHFVSVTDGHVDPNTTLETPSVVVKKEFESEQSCKEEISVNLGIEAPSIFVGDTQFDNYSTQEFPPTEVKKEVELQKTCEEGTPITVNREASSLLDTLIDSQLVKSICLVYPNLVTKGSRDTHKELVRVNAFVENITEEQDMEMTQTSNITEGTCSKELAKDLSFECTDCGKRFRNENILTIHQRVHTYNSKKPCMCNYCGRMLTSRHSLLMHLRRKHTGEKPYECYVCKKKFVNFSSCRSHMNNHTSEKTYECHRCKKKFINRTYLNSHIRTHDNSKNKSAQANF